MANCDFLKMRIIFYIDKHHLCNSWHNSNGIKKHFFPIVPQGKPEGAWLLLSIEKLLTQGEYSIHVWSECTIKVHLFPESGSFLIAVLKLI